MQQVTFNMNEDFQSKQTDSLLDDLLEKSL